MKKKLLNIALFSASALFLSGCMVGPEYIPPEIDLPCEWHSEVSDGLEVVSADCFDWWEALNDPILNSLIKRAAAQNLDLSIAATRVLEVRAQEKGAIYSLLPHLDASAACGNVQYNQRMLEHIVGAAPSTKHTPSKSKNLNFFEAGFDADWEIDLFGLHQHELKAVQAKIAATEESYRDIWITLSAEVARNYIELRGLQQRLKMLQDEIKSQNETQQLTEGLAQAGFSGTIDQRQAKQQLSILAAQQPQIQLSIQKAIHRLSILLGYTPGVLFAELSEPVPLPVLPCAIPIGFPSELLRRRPDIRKAERELAAATEHVGSAIAALFPRLSLKGFIGELGAFCMGNGLTWCGGPQLLLPIFNSRLLEQDVDLSKIQVQQAFYSYQKTVLDALEEVENAIASFHAEREKNRLLGEAQADSQVTNEIMLQLYQKGFKNYLEVLEVDRSFIATKEGYLQSQIESLLNYISLYKAMGGEWQCTICNDGF